MGNVTLPDIGLADYTLDNLARLKQLRKKCVGAKAEVCIERARLVTEYLRGLSNDTEPMITRYAGAVAYFLSHKASLFFDDNLLAGTTTSKYFGAPVYPEFTGMAIWPELDTISGRKRNPLKLSPADAETLNFKIFPYWMDRSILERTRARFKNPPAMKLFERIVFFLAGKAGCISHTVPCYAKALRVGLTSMIEEATEKERTIAAQGPLGEEERKSADFYRAVQIALKGILAYAGNLAAAARNLAASEPDPWRRENYRKMAEVCERVPANAARTFREALNSLWLIQVAIHAENINMAMSPGRLDQVLYPYYRRDMDEGGLDLGEAMELIGCLWLKFNDNANLVPETAEELFGGAGTVPAVTVGGVDTEGADAVNDLTYLMLRVTELLTTRDPNLNARYHYERNPKAYRDRLAEVIANTQSVPAIHNDVVDIEVMRTHEVKVEHSRDYAIIGCVELASAGRSYDASSSIILNLVSVLELTLYNGRRPVTGDKLISIETGDPSAFKTFGEFLEAFQKQLAWMIEQAVGLNNMFGAVYQEFLPSPLLSAFFEGPMDKGRDLIFGGALYNSSGSTHVGFADTVDSLSAVETAVFTQKKCTFPDLLTALKADFKGYEKLHAWLVNRTPRYGTDDPVAVRNSQELIRFLHDTYCPHENYRGGRFKPAFWTMTNHAGQGQLSGALPNGRRARRNLASGITPVSQAACRLEECLRAVGGLDGLHIPGGVALNLKYPVVDVTDPQDVARFGSAVEAYFRAGGLHIQFNIMSYEMLIEAKEDKTKHPELLVRVSGYSAKFNDLNEAMKDEIITRSAYDLRKGMLVPFPGGFTAMLPFEPEQGPCAVPKPSGISTFRKGD